MNGKLEGRRRTSKGEPGYLASPGGLALPRILAAIATMISSGWKGVLGKL